MCGIFGTTLKKDFSSSADANGDYVYVGNTGSLGIGTTNPGSHKVNIYNSTADYNGTGKPSTTIVLDSYVNSTGEGPSVDFNLRWDGNSVYASTSQTTGWLAGRIAGIYHSQGTNAGALAFYTNSGGSGYIDGNANDPSVSEKMRLIYNGNLGLSTTTPTNILSLGGTAARTIWMERNTTAATAGQGLTLSSGGAIAGTADLAGGDLTFKSGISTGTGTSALHFYTATAGSTGTSDNTPTEKMTILGSGNVGIGTTAPGAKLQVSSGTAFNITGGVNEATIAITNSSANSVLRLGQGINNSLTMGWVYNATANDATASISTYSYLNPILINGSYISLQNGSGGLVGIGTTAPTSKLHVTGAVTGKALAIFDETGDQALLAASASGVTKLTVLHNGMVNGTAGGLATYTKAGTISDTDFTDTAVDGLMGFDSTDGRLYIRNAGAWSYIAKTAGFQIPDFESGGLSEGDYLIPYVEKKMGDGAVHGLYAKWSDVKNILLAEIKTIIENFKEEFSTKKAHIEELCIGKTDDEVCLNKEQIKNVLDNLPSPTPTASTSEEPIPSPSEESAPTIVPGPSPTPEATPSATPI